MQINQHGVQLPKSTANYVGFLFIVLGSSALYDLRALELPIF